MKRLLILLGFGGLGLYGLWGYVTGVHVLRYRLTLDATCDGHTVSSSSVIETELSDIKTQLFPFLRGVMSPPAFNVELKGQAIVLDLCSYGTLFVVLRRDETRKNSDDPINFPVRQTGGQQIQAEQNLSARQALAYALSRTGPINIPLDHLPMLVKFRNIDDPTSVELVEPNDLASQFGAGVSLDRATFQFVSPGTWPFYLFGITEGVPVTTGIEQRLKWLTSSVDGGELVPGHGEPASQVPPAQMLGFGDFRSPPG